MTASRFRNPTVLDFLVAGLLSVALRLAGATDWPWLWVLLPFWAPPALFGAAAAVTFAALAAALAVVWASRPVCRVLDRLRVPVPPVAASVSARIGRFSAWVDREAARRLGRRRDTRVSPQPHPAFDRDMADSAAPRYLFESPNVPPVPAGVTPNVTVYAGSCGRCGSPRDPAGYCTDEACPFDCHKPHCPAGWEGHPTGPVEGGECVCRKAAAGGSRP